MDVYKNLISHFGTQDLTAVALKVTQGAVSAWASGKNGMSGVVAMRAERITEGKFKAEDLVRDKTRERGPAPKPKPKEKTK